MQDKDIFIKLLIRTYKDKKKTTFDISEDAIKVIVDVIQIRLLQDEKVANVSRFNEKTVEVPEGQTENKKHFLTDADKKANVVSDNIAVLSGG